MSEQEWKEFAGESASSQSSGRAFAFDLKALFALITWAAISASLWSILTFAGQVLLSIYLIVFFIGKPNTRRAALVLLPIMYLPYLWLFWDIGDYPWHGYRWDWIGIMLQLPGLLAEIPFHPLDGIWFEVITCFATLVVFSSFVLLARINLWTLIATALIAAGVSSVNSAICLALYRV
ncbi:MAG: hypothetical protein AAF394_07315 [Planctomycetota bacterium]